MAFKAFRRNRSSDSDRLGGNGKTPIIDLRKLVKTYSNAAGDFTVLEEIDAQVYSREFVR